MSHHHFKKLKTICRLSNGFIRDDTKTYKALQFAEEILEIYRIDVNNEGDDQYPSGICSKHSRLLYRYRETKGKSLLSSSELKSLQPKLNFFPHNDHDDSCQVCSTNSTEKSCGRPRKRRKGDCSIEVLDGSEIDEPVYEVIAKQATNKINIETTYNAPSASSDNLRIMLSIQRMKEILAELTDSEKKKYFFEIFNILTTEELSLFCNCIGRRLRDPIVKDSKTFYYMYKDITAVADFNILLWLQKRHSAVIAYLMGLCKLDNVNELLDKKQETMLIARAVEQIYSICNKTLIMPISFLLGLSAYSMTGSKALVDMLGYANPSGQ